ncbi:MAG: penicillin-insensitive murein DD-endopeptidase [Solirubrobacteraceae bacterium]|nr:penicillin-insensitive murein DD-endopeptidase [Solirubrobacteraceae bacterium]
MRSLAALLLAACLAVGVMVVEGPGAPAQPPRQDPGDGPPGAVVDPGATVPATAPPAPVAPVPAASAPAQPAPLAAAPARRARSRAIGAPWRGRLVHGVQFPEVGQDHLTWDAILKRTPNRPWRRWGTDTLVATIERVLAAYHVAYPDAPQVLVGDLSRPQGGVFDERYGGLGHASHQNGLDVDVYYPRVDGALRAAWRPDQVDRVLSQALVDRFVRAGAQLVFVGTRTRLRGPRKVVEAIPHHNDHLHVRIAAPRASRGPRVGAGE